MSNFMLRYPIIETIETPDGAKIEIGGGRATVLGADGEWHDVENLPDDFVPAPKEMVAKYMLGIL